MRLDRNIQTRSVLASVYLVLLLSLGAAPSFAETVTWAPSEGGATSWSNQFNWFRPSGGFRVPGSGDDVVIDDNPNFATNVVIDTLPNIVQSLRLDSDDSLTLRFGGTLELTAGGQLSGGLTVGNGFGGTLTNDAGATLDDFGPLNINNNIP